MNNFQKASEYYYLKDYATAIEMYKKSSTNYEDKSVCMYNSAVCYIKMKQYPKAIPLLNSAINIKKKSNYYFNLAYCYAMIKNYKKALIYFNTAWALDKTDTDCEKAINLILNQIKK